MIRNITVGIDIGTSSVRVAVAEHAKGEAWPRIIATGEAESRGMRHGYVTHPAETIKSVERAIREAEKHSGIKIRKAFLSINSVSLGSEIGLGSAIISKADSEVTTLDVTKAINESEETLNTSNRKILHTIPIMFKLDGKEVYGAPQGQHGVKLEVKTHFVTCLEQHVKQLINVVSEAGVEVLDVVASPLAASTVTISDRQKVAGCILIDIGSETVSVGVFENGSLVSTHVFSLGGTDITNDIALGLQVSLEDAEGIKIGSVMNNIPRKKLDEIVNARLFDIFELIDNYLRKLKRSGLLPAGAILVGGGSQIPRIEEIAKEALHLPVKTGGPEFFHLSKNKIKDPSWMTVYGLCIATRESAYDPSDGGGFTAWWKNFKKSCSNMLKQLMP